MNVRLAEMLKCLIQLHFPKVYFKIILVASPFLLLLKSGKMILSGRQAYWKLQVDAGEKFLNSSWKPRNSVENPLRLPLETIKEIAFPSIKDFAQFNPSIRLDHDLMTVAWRISNNIMNPLTNDHGEAISPLSGFESGVGIGQLQLNTSAERISITNSSIVIHYLNELRPAHNRIVDRFGRRIEFDDPRYLSEDSNLILLHGRHVPHSRDPSVPNFSLFLYDVLKDSISPINFPASGKYEKNWVPIPQPRESHQFLRSTFPLSLVRLDKNSLIAEEEILLPASGPAFHNGSNLISLDKDLLIRVVRLRVHVANLRAIHISHLVIHDKSLKKQKISKPFIFKGFGYEICNSIAVSGDKVFFAWGENDERSFLGWISTLRLRDWISENS